MPCCKKTKTSSLLNSFFETNFRRFFSAGGSEARFYRQPTVSSWDEDCPFRPSYQVFGDETLSKTLNSQLFAVGAAYAEIRSAAQSPEPETEAITQKGRL
jgi:hypothetical protein